MTTYRSDWESLSATLETNRSPVLNLLRAFWNDPSLSESAYFEVLGHLARNGAGAEAAARAVSVAARRLVGSGVENAAAAIDLQSERCGDAIRALRFGKREDDDPENPIAALIAGREALEGIWTLLLLIRLQDLSIAAREDFHDLDRRVRAAVEDVDATVERFAVLERLEFEFKSELAHKRYGYLKPLSRLHAEDWWHAVAIRANRRMRKALERGAEALQDDFETLSRWVATLRRVQWGDVREAESVCGVLAVHIDDSYVPRSQNSAMAARVLRILWDATSDQMKKLASREGLGDLALVLARNVTLMMTLCDRINGTALPGARVPNDLQRLGWAAHAWRTARLLQHEDGVSVINAFRRHHWWRIPQQPPLEHPEAVAAGCVAAAWYVGQTGYREESETWLARAEQFARSAPVRSLSAVKARRIGPIAAGYIELASLWLQAPEDAERSATSAYRAVVLANECSEDAGTRHLSMDVALRAQAMTIRARAFDFKGEFLRAMEQRHEALEQIENATLGVKRLPYALMEAKRELQIGLGDIDAAANTMLQYVVLARQRRDHELADAVALSRANLLLDYGYQEAGLEALGRLARQRARSASVSRARALLMSIMPAVQTLEFGPWNDLEATAQSLANEARRALGTPAAADLIDEALRANARLLALNPSDLVALTRKAQLLVRRGEAGDYEVAEAILDRLSNNDAYVLFCRGLIAYRRKNYTAAASWLREAYELAPRAETAAFLANALTRARQLPAALRLIEAHHSVEDDAPLLDARGMVQASLGNYVQAWESLEQAFVAVSTRRAARSDDAFDVPGRRIAMFRRMAALAPHVAAANPSLIDRFLRRDAHVAHRFILACVRSLAFEDQLREAILACADVAALKRAVAQYAMGACVYVDTIGAPDEVPAIVERMWKELHLEGNASLVAEFLAGGKSAYRASIRSAFDGAAQETRENCNRWFSLPDVRFGELTAHIATTFRSATYYRDTEALVARYSDVTSSFEVLLRQVRSQLPHIRLSNLDPELSRAIKEVASTTDVSAQLDAVVRASILAGPIAVVVSTDHLGLVDAPRYLLDVTPHTIRLAIRSIGAPTSCVPVATEGSISDLKISFAINGWPANLRELLDREQLLCTGDEVAISVPVEATPDPSVDVRN
jgi:tetratricopeptide (TPR) repeat protein